ncbi:MAG: DMT family transporter [Lachnospiraceae bacterium]|nr:DMT family transporter [Lachnospiraceae bacterium]
MNKKRSKIISSLLLLLTSLIWGSAFVAQSVGTEYTGPWTFVFSRYVLSTLVLIPVTILTNKAAHNDNTEAENRSSVKNYITGGLCCGLFLGLASIAQQAGIEYTTAGKAGFITTLYVVLVPLISLFFGKKAGKKVWFCAFLGLCGLYLISVKEGFSIEKGDALVMLCALLFSFQILCVDHFSAKVKNVVVLSNIQFFVSTLIGFTGMLIFERPTPEGIIKCAVPILYAGILSGAAGYTLQMVAQKNTDPSVASLIMSMESVFAALTGWLILGQSLSPRELTGCIVLFTAVILSELPDTVLPSFKRHTD